MINKQRLLDEFIELVSVPCPSKDEKAEADLIIKKLAEIGIIAEVDEAGVKSGSTTGNVWAFIPANVDYKVPGLMFEAHMDSVAPTTGTKVVRKDGVLYSDGTTTLGGDDKVGIAASLEAIKVILENNLPHGDIQLCFTIGEEIGSIGVRHMDPSWIKADIGYCLDEGLAPGYVNNAAPRSVKVFVKITGKAAHAGVEPEKGINAIMLAAQALTALPAYGRLDDETTLSVGKIEGGLASNIVAPNADTADITVEEGSPAMSISESDPGVVFVKEAAAKLGLPFKTFKSGGCTDGNYLCGMGLPCVALSTGMDKIHTTEECLKEEDLYNLTRLIVEIINAAVKKK